jgi:hypothetical protein
VRLCLEFAVNGSLGLLAGFIFACSLTLFLDGHKVAAARAMRAREVAAEKVRTGRESNTPGAEACVRTEDCEEIGPQGLKPSNIFKQLRHD